MPRRYSVPHPLPWLLALLGCGHASKMTQPNQPPPPNPNAAVSGVAWCGTHFVAVAG